MASTRTPTAAPHNAELREPSSTLVDRVRRVGRSPDFGWALASALLLWTAFPPLNVWPLAWIAPVGWIRLVQSPTWRTKHPYWMLYLVGVLHWLLLIQWVRLPHWSAWFGWLVLAAYLAVYLPLFIGASRVLVHRWGMSSVLAVPLVWTGFELLRGYLFTGFAMSLLAHSQVSLLPVVQIASVTGAYGVSFVVMLTAAALERTFCGPRPRLFWPLPLAAATIAACWMYGLAWLHNSPTEPPARTLRVALIQGAFDTQFDGDAQRANQAFFDYVRLSRQAAGQFPDLDLIVWPESMFTGTEPMVSYEPPVKLIAGWDGTVEQLSKRLEEIGASVRSRFGWVAQQVRTPLLVGLAWDHLVAGRMQRFNSAVFADRDGAIRSRYDKMHPVMFGEYVPLGDWFPWLYRLTPMPDGLTAGAAPLAITVDGARLAVNICFENTVPQLIRRQVQELERRGESPDVLITITNDGWFWGSSLLDAHLACGLFRAVEMRRPLLIAANTGFSAWIDPRGRILAQGPRRAEATLLAEVPIESLPSRYLQMGDLFAGLCLAIAAAGLLSGLRPSIVRPA